MAKKTDKSLELLSDLLSTARKIGVNNTQIILRSATVNVDKDTDLKKQAVIDYLITMVCNHYAISRNELIEGTSHGNRMDALRICFVVCRRTLRFSTGEIAVTFQKDRSNVSKDITRFNRFRNEKPKERVHLDFCNNCTEEVKKYLLNLDSD